MLTFLRKTWVFIAKFFAPGGAAATAVKKALEIVPVALPVVEMVAKLTPHARGRRDYYSI